MVAARRALLAACLAGSLLAAADAPALAAEVPGLTVLPDATAQVVGHVLDVAASARKVSPFVATDLSALTASAGIVGAVSTAQSAAGGVLVAGRTQAGHVSLLSADAGPKNWSVLDLTVLGAAPTAVGTPAVVIDNAGVTRVFYRTASGDLAEIENDRPAPNPWFSSDLTTLTASTGGSAIAGDPVALSAPGYATAVYARATTGALVAFTLTVTPGRPWYFTNVSKLALGPPIAGNPAPVRAPDGFGLTTVFAQSAGGKLVEFTNDDYGWHLWSVRDVSGVLKLPRLASSPTVLAGLPAVVAATTSAGHLLAVRVPTASLKGASVQDLSVLAARAVATGRTPSIIASGGGFAIGAVTTDRHLALFRAASATAKVATYTDATMQPLTEQLAGADPVAVSLGGATHLFVPSAGFLGLIPRIVLGAMSQDQFHAKVIDTPAGSNCNPYSASFNRGSTAGCAPGTSAEQWCSDFAQWVWKSAGVDTAGITGASKTFVTWGRARNQFLQGIRVMPAVGDAVVWGVLNPLWGAHVGIVVAVKGDRIDVVSGNSGPDHVVSAVWRSGLFTPKSQTAQGDPIIGYASPVALSAKDQPHVASVWTRGGAWPLTSGAGSLAMR